LRGVKNSISGSSLRAISANSKILVVLAKISSFSKPYLAEI
jgi:hypothetical protein